MSGANNEWRRIRPANPRRTSCLDYVIAIFITIVTWN
jgi:hypothetical protein